MAQHFSCSCFTTLQMICTLVSEVYTCTMNQNHGTRLDKNPFYNWYTKSILYALYFVTLLAWLIGIWIFCCSLYQWSFCVSSSSPKTLLSDPAVSSSTSLASCSLLRSSVHQSGWKALSSFIEIFFLYFCLLVFWRSRSSPGWSCWGCWWCLWSLF